MPIPAKSLVDRLARETGLHENTVRDLLVSGWKYVKLEGHAQKWEKHENVVHLRRRKTA